MTLDLPSDRHQPGSNKQFLRKKTRPRSSSVYRMASTFELGDEQVFKRNEKKENGRDFGKYYCKFIMIMVSPICLYDRYFFVTITVFFFIAYVSPNGKSCCE